MPSSLSAEVAALLRDITKEALDVAKKARRNRKSLAGDNFYGNKFVDLKASATEAFEDLPAVSMGDATALLSCLRAFLSPRRPRQRG